VPNFDAIDCLIHQFHPALCGDRLKKHLYGIRKVIKVSWIIHPLSIVVFAISFGLDFGQVLLSKFCLLELAMVKGAFEHADANDGINQYEEEAYNHSICNGRHCSK